MERAGEELLGLQLAGGYYLIFAALASGGRLVLESPCRHRGEEGGNIFLFKESLWTAPPERDFATESHSIHADLAWWDTRRKEGGVRGRTVSTDSGGGIARFASNRT